jgi:hypothetical protein
VVSGALDFGVDQQVNFSIDLARISLFSQASEQRL